MHRLITVTLLVAAALMYGAAAWSITPPVPDAPDIDARAYILVDYQSGEIIAAREPDMPVEPASLTKMMTIYAVAHELAENRITLQDEVLVSEKAWRMSGSRMFIEVGRKVTVDELMHGDIIQSGNDASVALAEFVSGSEDVFAALMNQHAHRLGLSNTHYTNSTGLPDPDHITTARDVATLGMALVRDFPDIYRIFSMREYTYNGIEQSNRNRLLWRDETADGIKTGYTESAGYCLAASAIRDGRRLVAVVVGASSARSRVDGAATLLNFGFRFYETQKVFDAAQTVTSIPVFKGESETLAVGLDETLFVTVPRGRYPDIAANMNLETPLLAPISQGQQVGTLELSLDGEPVASRPLRSLQAVEEAGIIGRMIDSVRLMLE